MLGTHCQKKNIYFKYFFCQIIFLIIIAYWKVLGQIMVNNETYNSIFAGILKKYINEMSRDLKKNLRVCLRFEASNRAPL